MSTPVNGIDTRLQDAWASNPQWQSIMARAQEIAAAGSGQADDVGYSAPVPFEDALHQAMSEAGPSGVPHPPAGYQIDPNGNLITATSNGIDWKNYAKYAGISLAAAAGAGAIPALISGGAGAAAGGGGAAAIGGNVSVPALSSSLASTMAANGASAILPSTIASTSAGSSLIPKLIKGAASLGSSLGDMSKERANGRAAEDIANVNYDKANVDRSIAAGNNYQRNESNAIRGGLLQGLQDSTITAPQGVRMGTISGGLRPSAITGKEAIGQQVQMQAMKNLLASDQSGDTTTPAMTPRPSSNGFDTALNIASPILSLADLLKPANYNTLPVPPTATGASKTTFGVPSGLRLLPPQGSY